MSRPTLEPVTDAMLAEFAHFLYVNLQCDRSPEAWVAGLRQQWAADRPNYGFVVREVGHIVGGIGAYYADRVVRGQLEKFCNITSWCVLDAFRQQSMRLAMAVIGQKGYHFTDFSPTKVVGSILRFFKFRELDARVAVILNRPGFFPRDVRVLHRPDDIGAALTPDALKIYHDHAFFRGSTRCWSAPLATGAMSFTGHVCSRGCRPPLCSM